MSSSYLTLPYLSQRGAIQVHHPFCWSHTVDLVLQRGSLLHCLQHYCFKPFLQIYIADELEQYLSKKVPVFSLPVKKKPRQDKLVLGIGR